MMEVLEDDLMHTNMNIFTKKENEKGCQPKVILRFVDSIFI